MPGVGAKCYVMALCLGPGGPKVLFGTYSHTQKVQNWDQGSRGPFASATVYSKYTNKFMCRYEASTCMTMNMPHMKSL